MVRFGTDLNQKLIFEIGPLRHATSKRSDSEPELRSRGLAGH